MQIIHAPQDSEFKSKDPQSLKKEIEEYYTYKGYTPEVIIKDGLVIVNIDDVKLQKAENDFNKAVELATKGKLNESKKLLNKIIKVLPAYSEAYRMLAQIEMNNGNVDEAIDINIDALKNDPNNEWALILMGNLLSQGRDNYAEGESYFKKVLKLNPDNSLAINNLGGMYLKAGQYEKAIEMFDKALEYDNTYGNAYYGKACAYQQMGKKELAFESARLGVLNAKELPQNPGVRQELISMLIQTAKEYAPDINYENVIKTVRNAVELYDKTPIVFEKDEAQTTFAKLEYAPYHGTDKHYVKYKIGSMFHHYLVHEMIHLLMQAKDANHGIQKIVVSTYENRRNLDNVIRPYMSRLETKIGKDHINELKETLMNGISLQVMNCPLDLFVEEKIFTYPEMRPIQLLSLLTMEKNNIEGALKSEKEKVFPPMIVNISKVLLMVSSMMLKKLYGVDFVKHYKPTKAQYDMAKDLFEEYLAYVDTYKNGDEYELVEYFVDTINFGQYITIKDFEQSDLMASSHTSNDDILTDDEKKRQKQFNEAHNEESRNPMIDFMMSMYMEAALEYFENMPMESIRKIAYEIAMLGVGGIDPNKKSGYKIPSIPDMDFGGYQLLAFYYVSWKIAEPMKLKALGLPFDRPYEAAKMMYDKKKGKGNG